MLLFTNTSAFDRTMATKFLWIVAIAIAIQLPSKAAAIVTRLCYNATDESFTVDGSCSEPVATADFEDLISSEGWSYLEVVTSPRYPDEIQAYSAGVVEGIATHSLMQNHYRNTIANYCNGSGAYCKKLVAFLQKNLDWMYAKIAAHPNDSYWRQVNLVLLQIAGLEEGNAGMVIGPRKIGVLGCLFFQLQGDLMDLEFLFGKRTDMVHESYCSAFVKPINNGQELLISHVTWEDYNNMLRIQKMYKFAFKDLGNAHTATFSSYPGTVFSLDDFYLLSSGLVVTETSLNNYNKSSLQLIKPNSLLTWMRTLVANRLARTGPEWATYYKKLQSGTYNNQFTIVNFNLFKPGAPLSDGLFTLLETMPGTVASADLTYVLREKGYWPSYNRAYFPEIYQVSGAAALAANSTSSTADWFSYNRTARAKMFARGNSSVVDMATLTKLMRYNDFKNDPFSACNCSPPYTAEFAISARNDLNDPNGKYPFEYWGYSAFGAYDFKGTNYELFKLGLEFVAISGPTYDQQPAFSWSKSGFDKTVPHFGHPDEWHFPTVLHKWQNL